MRWQREQMKGLISRERPIDRLLLVSIKPEKIKKHIYLHRAEVCGGNLRRRMPPPPSPSVLHMVATERESWWPSA